MDIDKDVDIDIDIVIDRLIGFNIAGMCAGNRIFNNANRRVLVLTRGAKCCAVGCALQY